MTEKITDKIKPAMDGTLKILFIEDVIYDAELNWREIEKNGITFVKLLVDNKKDFLEGLEFFKPDIIISDYSLPQFDGLQALLLRNDLAPQTPFIIVTGSVNEEVAVECMKAGADDYVIKEHLARLPFAIKEALENRLKEKEKKAVEEALQVSEEKFRSIMENSADAIFITDQQGKYVYTNKAVTDMLGFSSEEIQNMTILDLAPKNKKDEYMEIFHQLQHKGKLFTEIELLRKNGNFISTDLNAIILPGGLVYGSSRDITERKHAKEELIKAKDKAEEGDRLKSAFLHNISHEIRTPLNAIVGFSALLGEPDVDAQSRKDYIEVIMQSSDHLLAIISDIVDISNIEANLVKITKNEININSALHSLCNHFIQKADEKKIKLVCETMLSDTDALVVTDSTKLNQILINLLSNAVKFTDSGYIKLLCTVNKDSLEFCVSDTGLGIPPEYHERIFDRFYQVQHSISRLYEGTGLGLAITKAHVELMGGKIWLSSDPGKGTSFYFTIPYEKQTVKTKEANEKEMAEDFVFPEKKTILVAEDTESTFKLINYFLSNVNTTLIRAANGKEAVEIFLSNKNIDLVLMDIKMPVMDGYTAVRLIREKNSKIPIIAQTAYIDYKDQALEFGFSGYILKPFDKKGLLKVLQEFI